MSKSGLDRQGVLYNYTYYMIYAHSTVSSLVVRISAEVSRPRDDRQSDGTFLIAMELTAMGSPAWENLRYAWNLARPFHPVMLLIYPKPKRTRNLRITST